MPKPVQKPDHISQEDWDAVDSPPLTQRMLDRMRPARESMPTKIFEKLTKGRGPQKTAKKEAVSLRLDRDVVEHFRAMGPRWQTKINRVLRETVKAESTAIVERKSTAASSGSSSAFTPKTAAKASKTAASALTQSSDKVKGSKTTAAPGRIRRPKKRA